MTLSETIIKLHDNVYRELQQNLDRAPISYPATESGVELRILRHLFSPEEAFIASKLAAMPKLLEKIYEEVLFEENYHSFERVERVLDEMYSRGLIRCSIKTKDGQDLKYYNNAPLVVGFYEFQLNRLTEDLVRDVDQYFEEAFIAEANRTGIPQFRTIPVDQAIGIERNTMTYDDLRTILENSGDLIVINECICRKKHDLLNDSCKRTDMRETCISFRSLAKEYLKKGLGRKVTKNEALEILSMAEKEGLVLQPGNAQNPLGMCCCCGCCCDLLVNQKKFNSPAQYFASNYYAELDSDVCVNCGVCESRCNMDAITIKDGKYLLDLTRCIGCGNCSLACPVKAITLVKKQEEVLPPKNGFETYKAIAIEKMKLK
ncbi:MAG: ATP-binding protein [Promethearchaeota archaeon]|jgi:ferredoxin